MYRHYVSCFFKSSRHQSGSPLCLLSSPCYYFSHFSTDSWSLSCLRVNTANKIQFLSTFLSFECFVLHHTKPPGPFSAYPCVLTQGRTYNDTVATVHSVYLCRTALRLKPDSEWAFPLPAPD